MNNLPPMTLFDYMVCSRENNMLKAFLPFIDKDFQPLMATYIKFSELLATIDLFRHNKNIFGDKSDSFDFTNIISCMLPYMDSKERDMFEAFNNIKNTMDMFEAYKDMLSPDMMSTFEGFGSADDFDSAENTDSTNDSASDSTGSSMSDMLSSMLSPEQQLMFEQLSGMMNTTSNA